MNNWSIKAKLYVLSGLLLSLLVISGGVALYGERLLMKELTDVGEVQLPAIENMTLLDMYHDSIQGAVYQSFAWGKNGSEEQKNELAEELQEKTKAIQRYIAELDKLKLRPEVRDALNKVKPEIKKYIEAGEETVAISLTGRTDLAEKKLPNFNGLYSALEEKLANLDKLIKADAANTTTRAHVVSRQVNAMTFALIIGGLLAGILLAWWVIRGLINSLGTVMDELNESSRHVSHASEESAGSATTLSEASTQQAASLQETMASIEEISAMVKQNADSADKVKETVDVNHQVSEEGAHSVEEMVNAIGEIKATNDDILAQMEASNREFSEIVKIITEIGDKTKVINDIVFQTKLLSFNASVEAARAGEHGKGFAVVAEEVGNLAQMSGNASKEIADMLGDSIRRVNDIVDQTARRVDQLVQVGRSKIAMGESTAQKCREALMKINENARVVASTVAEITTASKEQSQGIQEINKAIGQLDIVTQKNSSVAQQSSKQASGLKTEADQLLHAVTELAAIVNGGEHHPISVPIKKSAPVQAAPQTKPKLAPALSRPKFEEIKPEPTLKPKPTYVPEYAERMQKAVGAVIPPNDHPDFKDI